MEDFVEPVCCRPERLAPATHTEGPAILAMVAGDSDAPTALRCNCLPSLRHLVFVWSVRSPGVFQLAVEEVRQTAAEAQWLVREIGQRLGGYCI